MTDHFKYRPLPERPVSKATQLGTLMHQVLEHAFDPGSVDHDKSMAITREQHREYVQRRIIEQAPRLKPGQDVTALNADDTLFHGKVLTHRGVEVRVGNGKTIKTFISRNVFPA